MVGIRLLIGIVIALLDYHFAQKRCTKKNGVDYPKKSLEAIEYILDTQNNNATKSSQYDESIHIARGYFASIGLIRDDVGLLSRLKQLFARVSCQEMINQLPYVGLLILACCLELINDFLYGLMFSNDGSSGFMTSIISDLYQIPLLFIGLLLGRKIRNLWHFIKIDEQQRAIENMILECVDNTAILNIILTTANHAKDSGETTSGAEDVKIKLTRTGKKVYQHIESFTVSISETAKDVAEGISNYQKQREEQIEKDKQAVKSKFDDITKGH